MKDLAVDPNGTRNFCKFTLKWHRLPKFRLLSIVRLAEVRVLINQSVYVAISYFFWTYGPLSLHRIRPTI